MIKYTLETRLYSAWDFRFGEKELSKSIQELSKKMSPVKTRPFYQFLKNDQLKLKAVLSLSLRNEEIPDTIRFVKLPKDYRKSLLQCPEFPWAQDSYSLPGETIIRLVEDFSIVVNELGLLSKGEKLRYCAAKISKGHDHGYVWIDNGNFSFDDNALLFSQIPANSCLSGPAAFPLSTSHYYEKDRPSRSHLQGVHIDDLIFAYAANFNEGIE